MKRIKTYNKFREDKILNEEINFRELGKNFVKGVKKAAKSIFIPLSVLIPINNLSSQNIEKIEPLQSEIPAIRTAEVKANTFKEKVDEEFQKIVESKKDEAINWWRIKLNSEETKKKLKEHHNLDDEGVKNLLQQYSHTLDTIVVKIVDIENEDDMFRTFFAKTLGWVNDKKMIAYINYHLAKDRIGYIKPCIIHEIQHLLDYVKPLTSMDFVSKTFPTKVVEINKDTAANKLTKMFDFSKEESLKIVEKLEKMKAKEFESPKQYNYIFSDLELSARITTMRDYFQKNQITKENLKEYLKNIVKTDAERNKEDDIDYFIIQWSAVGYPDIDEIIKHINLFVDVEKSDTYNFATGAPEFVLFKLKTV